MLLRRVIEHVKVQNWTAVGLDFVIVVVGVFIGIQVSNWNDARANTGIAARHLSEIAEDISAHLAFHDQLYGSALRRIAAANYLLSEGRGETLPEAIVISVSDNPVPAAPEPTEDELDPYSRLAQHRSALR